MSVHTRLLSYIQVYKALTLITQEEATARAAETYGQFRRAQPNPNPEANPALTLALTLNVAQLPSGCHSPLVPNSLPDRPQKL